MDAEVGVSTQRDFVVNTTKGIERRNSKMPPLPNEVNVTLRQLPKGKWLISLSKNNGIVISQTLPSPIRALLTVYSLLWDMMGYSK